MDDTWKILVKELAYHGIRLKDGFCQLSTQDGKIVTSTLEKTYLTIQSEIKDNIDLFTNISADTFNLISQVSVPEGVIDEKSIDLFIFSLKDLAKFYDIFDEYSNMQIKEAVQQCLERDIETFNFDQIKTLPDFKISLDWLHRLISRQYYIGRLIRFAMLGKSKVNTIKIKTAAGISGPWANLDLPAGERFWSWDDEDANFRGRDKDIRNQRRYRKGLQNYNNDGRVGEGHYWRELRNEPYSWNDREGNDPYSHRNVLTRK